MGTRGTYGFRKNGNDYLTYNHFDSYPDYLGRNVITFCMTTGVDTMNQICDKLVMVDEDKKIAKKHEAYIKEFGNPDGEDYYGALRAFQGNLDKLEAVNRKSDIILMTDARGFIRNSLFCEYGYIINLDDNVLEFYKGFQTSPDPEGRYEKLPDDEYYPCRMVLRIPFDQMKSVSEIIERMNESR